MSKRNTHDDRQESLRDLVKRAELNNAYRNEGVQRNTDGHTESLVDIIEHQMILDAFKDT